MSHHSKPWLLLISTYTTQYIGIAFMMSATFAILRQHGIALDKLALLNLIALPMLGKILYAPFVDSFRLFTQGQYRSWLLFAQLCMTGLLLVCGYLEVNKQFPIMLVLFIVYSLFMSIQDVAIDGLATKIFEASERQFANSIQYASNLLGNIIGGGLLLILYPWLQWKGAFIILALLTAITWIQLLFYREPENEFSNPHHNLSSQFKSLAQQLKLFITKHKSWFVLLFIYPIGFTAVFGILNPLLVDAKWSLVDIGFATKVFGSIIGILSAFLATLLINQLQRKKALITLTVMQGLTLLLFIPLTLGYTSKPIVYLAIFGYFIANPGLIATLSTLIMDRAASMPAKATFFSLQLSLVVFMGFVYSALGLTLAQHIGYTAVVILTFICALGVAALSWKLLSPDDRNVPT
ncbi:PAT family beta-lactamase induction signal transducer AmpG [Acinetobacter baylyi]|uniref:PAT family beta-lactamase induction signal transducer AmpG n=1 Tax=Acinetobacter baylyi TaxID=202950 RepID=A0ABU0UZS3_ACIBI|nr:MFS transporter [Acinetobacter baylyi]MDQ1210067.1 PAT family beta-lactamase induction signal transducer AmpG [Acinetobacter baylyi]MDR6106336.1 PAT family beta-lactamase induction signal transducer AmpG [Acinetobacter baylyi]MDR6186937.1 PAT family beta-lactamase induction signal transducer AmpG [Acinetobacter baylyi]